MATRNERRRRAKERAAAEARPSHGGRMLAFAVEKSADPQQELQDEHWLEMYSADKAVSPPLPLDGLWQLYEENAIHSGCINAKVADSVGRGWHLEEEDDARAQEGGDPGENEGGAHDADALTGALVAWLAERCKDPTGMPMPWSAISAQWIREFEATGWGILEIGREGDEIALIAPLPAHTLRTTKDSDVYVQVRGQKKVYFKRFGAEGNVNPETGDKSDSGAKAVVERRGRKVIVNKATAEAEELIANEVLILKHYSPRTPYYGIPQWVSGVPTLAELVAIREYNVSWHESGGVGDKIVWSKANDPDEAKSLSDSLADQFKRTKGRGHSTYFAHGSEDAELEVMPLSKNEGNRDGQFKERRYDLNTELLIAHQVPGYRVGWAIMGTLGGNAAEEMIDSYRYGVVEPIQEMAETLLNATIFNPAMGGFALPGHSFEFDDVDWAEMETELTKAETGVKLGAVKPNEFREMIGMARDDEDPALDEYWVMTQQGPMQLGAAPPEVSSAADAFNEMKKALDVVIKGVEAPDDAAAAPHTAREAEPDAPVAPRGDDAIGQ